MALMRLKNSFQNFKNYSKPVSVPCLVEQPAAPVEHEAEDPAEIIGDKEAENLEHSLSVYLSKSVFGYETNDDESEVDNDSDGK